MRLVVLPAKGRFGKEPGKVFGIELLWGLLSRQSTTGSGRPLRLRRVGQGESIWVKVPPKWYVLLLIYRHCWRQKTELGGPRFAQIWLFPCCYDFTQEHTFMFYFWRQKSKLLFLIQNASVPGIMQGCYRLSWKFSIEPFDPPNVQKSFDITSVQIFTEYNCDAKEKH